MKEAELQAAVRLALGSRDDVVMWRNNVGVANHFAPGATRPQVVRYGLAPGSADLVGIARGGRFVALELKGPDGRTTSEQQAWLALVERMGGIARVVRSVDEAVAVVDGVARSARAAGAVR